MIRDGKKSFGQNFIISPVAVSGNAETVILARDAATVSINGSSQTLNADDFIDLAHGSIYTITADKPLTRPITGASIGVDATFC